MASIYERKDSRFFWVKFRDPATGKPKGVSTHIDKKSPLAKRRARDVCATYTTKELAAPMRRQSREDFSQWAESYLRVRYKNPHTLDNAIIAFENITAFFERERITSPRQVTYAVACRFCPWLVATKNMNVNTAALRFVYFGVIMGEAFRRGFVPFNPCRGVRVERRAPKSKQEITEEHQAKFELALKEKAEWMREAWLILMRQGCRCWETVVPLERITETTITFKIKQGRFHTAKLHPDLLPLVEMAKKENRPTLIVPPVGMTGRFNKLFKDLELPYSIHCTRVTVITRLIRAGHPVALVSNFVGHSEEVDRIYQKLKPADSSALLSTLSSTTP